MWSQADLAVLVPVLGRVHRIEPLLDSLRTSTPQARVVFLTSPDDRVVHDEIDRHGAEQVVVPWEPVGDYARKINAGYRHTAEPLLFTGADDLCFHPGWFEAAAARATHGIGVVGTNDLTNRRVMTGRHSTHSLVVRSYVDFAGTIDEPGKVLHEGYVHEYVDDELVATAKKRRAWAFASDAHVEHLHPMGGKAPLDELYEAQAARMAASRDLFRRRARLWR